jgi:hypothetical protein
MFAFGGAVMLQDVPEHMKAGKRVREPIELPWVLETAIRGEDTRVSKKKEREEGGVEDIPATRETFMVLVVPWNKLRFVMVNWPP